MWALGVSISFIATAIAAEILNYTAPAGTITQYTTTSDVTTKIDDVQFKTTDGSPVSDEDSRSFRAALEQGTKTDLSSTGNMTEEVLNVLSDGTREVRQSVTVLSKMYKNPLTFELRGAYKPNGDFEMSDFHFDNKEIPAETSAAIEQMMNQFKQNKEMLGAGIYGIPLETSKSVQQKIPFKLDLGKYFEPINMLITRNITYMGRNTDSNHMFQILVDMPAYDMTLKLNEDFKILYHYAATTNTTEIHCMPDGRMEYSRSMVAQTATFDMQIPGSKIISSVKMTVTSKNSSAMTH